MKDGEIKVIRNCEFGQRQILHYSFPIKLSNPESDFMVQEDLSLKLCYNVLIHF